MVDFKPSQAQRKGSPVGNLFSLRAKECACECAWTPHQPTSTFLKVTQSITQDSVTGIRERGRRVGLLIAGLHTKGASRPLWEIVLLGAGAMIGATSVNFSGAAATGAMVGWTNRAARSVVARNLVAGCSADAAVLRRCVVDCVLCHSAHTAVEDRRVTVGIEMNAFRAKR